jgi:Ca-activated chloride channel family protein
LLCGRDIQAHACAQITFKSSVDLVNANVTVLDKKGGLITDLTEDDFEIFEDGKKQQIRFFARGDAESEGAKGPDLHLGLMLDASESMGEDMRFVRTAMVKFLNRLVDAVDITLIDFATEVRTARYSQADFARVIERIRSQKAQGWTAFYDAVGVHLDGAAGQDGRKILVIYTDGGDTRSSMTFSDLMKLLKASDVTVYSVGFLEHQTSSSRNEQRMILEQIAEVTGGRAFFPSSMKDLDEAYDKVLAEIRAQYSMGYISTNEHADGTWRKVEVKLTRPELKSAKIRARKGYFAPYKPSNR